MSELPVNPPHSAPACAICGARSRVHVLVGYDGNLPQLDHLCMPCANVQADNRAKVLDGNRRRVGYGSLLVFVGILLAMSGAVAAMVDLKSHSGFGWIQSVGVGLGAFMAVCGSLLGINLLTICGAFFVGVLVGFDWLAMRDSQRSWLEQAGACIGVASMLIGLGILRRRNEKRRKKESEACKP